LDTLTGLYVLVVEAHPEPRRVLSSLLRYSGALVSAADSVTSALETMRLVRPDLLVVDLGVAGTAAWDLIAALRALKPERGGTVPVIAIGSAPEQGDEARARGFDGFLSQPIDRAALGQLARRLILPS
jgi:CheY-like chemotaxis protein